MPTHQESLFPDDEAPALVPLGVAGSARVLTPARKRFNRLVAEIERARRPATGEGPLYLSQR
ncbi:MAG: hypothetical protein KIT35_16020 [Piscinibacter sp.]|uniref:hypothetical protein n=1 Tax=Piscinibacter sp. TaxID=1903157 RepID=UPI0025856D1D|nr:hypothetical protein [Piscinibacter sp.]MCW5665339.1 hypothetical protein [Piscinibacter sp.]